MKASEYFDKLLDLVKNNNNLLSTDNIMINLINNRNLTSFTTDLALIYNIRIEVNHLNSEVCYYDMNTGHVIFTVQGSSITVYTSVMKYIDKNIYNHIHNYPIHNKEYFTTRYDDIPNPLLILWLLFNQSFMQDPYILTNEIFLSKFNEYYKQNEILMTTIENV